MKWITDNPGRQILTGSFHPITDNEWWTDAYKSWNQPKGGYLKISKSNPSKVKRTPFRNPSRTSNQKRKKFSIFRFSFILTPILLTIGLSYDSIKEYMDNIISQ